MALGIYSNNYSFPQTPTELEMELLGFPGTPTHLLSSETCIDPLLLDPQNVFLPNPYFEIFSSDKLFPPQQLDSYPNPKRPKSSEEEDNYYFSNLPSASAPTLGPVVADLLDGFMFVPNPPVLPDFSPSPDFHSALAPQLPSLPPVYKCGSAETECAKKCKGAGVSLSAQSMAARQRRRKITEKTQELGKLVPGGHKMNTADMLEAAYKYIKFMQAQVSIFQLMKSNQENDKEAFDSEELQAIASSPRLQEKLYSSGKCLVAKSFVETLITDESELLIQIPK
ncbi:hypothetical protein NMG60_11005196 [Bertholletia excelsa]